VTDQANSDEEVSARHAPTRAALAAQVAAISEEVDAISAEIDSLRARAALAVRPANAGVVDDVEIGSAIVRAEERLAIASHKLLQTRLEGDELDAWDAARREEADAQMRAAVLPFYRKGVRLLRGANASELMAIALVFFLVQSAPVRAASDSVFAWAARSFGHQLLVFLAVAGVGVAIFALRSGRRVLYGCLEVALGAGNAWYTLGLAPRPGSALALMFASFLLVFRGLDSVRDGLSPYSIGQVLAGRMMTTSHARSYWEYLIRRLHPAIERHKRRFGRYESRFLRVDDRVRVWEHPGLAREARVVRLDRMRALVTFEGGAQKWCPAATLELLDPSLLEGRR